MIVVLWFFYVFYKFEVIYSVEVVVWVGGELKNMGCLFCKEWMLIGLVLFSLGLWVFGGKIINVIVVGLLVVLLMLVLYVVLWKDIMCYNSVWNILVNFVMLVVMVNGLICFGFIDWFVNIMSMYLEGFLLDVIVIVLVLVFYFVYYLFVSFFVYIVIMLLVILVVGKGILGVLME